ncbi:MAG: hypothetical protein HOC70_13775 [Gammaproteobacteria bacterium]|nr:hypothetical protein [Gammaproteobacteria bacterium]MBT4494305.1 hypothetical protein [Gammaproteobacteria bacterium]
MILSDHTLEKLRELINEEIVYRSGPRLVEFFNQLGFQDDYYNGFSQGFPSRWKYTDDCLTELNGTPDLDQCMRDVFAPVSFIGRFNELDAHIKDFNQYLTFDKWRVVREGAELSFKKLDKIEIDQDIEGTAQNESEFLNKEFTDVDVSKLGLDGPITTTLEHRVFEIEKCFSSEAYLAVILLAGSTLEGIFLGLATKYPKQFNSASAAPKDQSKKVRQFPNWTLNSFIDVSHELGLIETDTQKFSHSLRDFRNYIHPYEQMASRFRPREHTAKICLQVLKSAVHDMSSNIRRLGA